LFTKAGQSSRYQLAEVKMISNERYFAKRASEEANRAARAYGAEAKRWHQELAEKFNRLAREQ
jgi:hypothetical protein